MSKKRNTVPLYTKWEKNKEEVPFSDYPRPHLKRDSYLCLNGSWNLIGQRNGKTVFQTEITVPFPVESRLSGVERRVEKDLVLIYERSLLLPDDFFKGRVLLHFGAVDQFCRVFFNGTLLASHEGGYLPFSFEVTSLCRKGENFLRVEAWDPLDSDFPYGKQTQTPHGMWYTPASGIWQTVWMECVPHAYVRELKITPASDRITLRIDAEGDYEETRVCIQTPSGQQEAVFSGSETEIILKDPVLWSPENPYLYEMELIRGEDRIRSYFGLRTLEIRKRNGKSFLCLNGEPYFFHGLLDQGYFPDGIFLPASPEAYRDDLQKVKEMGFGMIRKHVKLEPELFYYECDRLGILVFQDMINSGKYSFLLDTALPTVFLRKGISHRASPRRRNAFLETSLGILDRLYHHPSVCYYTVFNEGWGQFSADEVYGILKKADPTRFFDTFSGWFRERNSDVESVHVYFRKIKLKPQDRPLILSEFGGFSLRVPNHVFHLSSNYGYGLCQNEQDLEQRLDALYRREALPAIANGLNGTVYTQLSDVEEETNGLLTYDRAVTKVSPKVMQAISQALWAEFRKITAQPQSETED